MYYYQSVLQIELGGRSSITFNFCFFYNVMKAGELNRYAVISLCKGAIMSKYDIKLSTEKVSFLVLKKRTNILQYSFEI